MTPEKSINEMFYDCLFKNDDEAHEHTQNGTVIQSKGVICNVGFHPERLKGHEARILEFIDVIVHDKFYQEGGGGMSFLELPFDKHGHQWCDFHQSAEQLFQLAQAIGHAGFCTEHPGLISLMPGGMPFIWFSKEKKIQ